MLHPVLVAGAAGGAQGSTGRQVASLLMERGIPVRAFVHKRDHRSDPLRQQGAEVIEGDLLNPATVRDALRGIKRAYFTYPVAEGLLEAAAIFAAEARDAGLEMVVNNSQFQGTPGDPDFRDLQNAPSFRNLQHRLADRVFDQAQVGVVHLQTPPYYENLRAFLSRGVAERDAVLMPWGEDTTVIPLAGAEDVSRVAATLLAGSDAPPQTIYPLVSETPTVRQITEALGRSIGRPLRYIAITDEQWADAVKERLNPHALDHLTHLWQYFRRGERHFHATDAVRSVTGRDPVGLEDFFRANAGAFGAGHRRGSESSTNLGSR